MTSEIFSEIYNKALDILSRREHSVLELKQKLKTIEVYERCFACRASAREVWWRDRTPANTHPGWSPPSCDSKHFSTYQHIGTLCLVVRQTPATTPVT